MSGTAYSDTFARDHMPPPQLWPEFTYDLPELRFADQVNCASVLLDERVRMGHGARSAIIALEGRTTSLQLLHQVNRIAHVLREDMGLVPGNRVLIPSPNSPMMAACMLATWKAGGIPVPTIALLRAGELAHLIDKARVTHALCDRRLTVEVEGARAHSPALSEVRYFFDSSQPPSRMSSRTSPPQPMMWA